MKILEFCGTTYAIVEEDRYYIRRGRYMESTTKENFKQYLINLKWMLNGWTRKAVDELEEILKGVE